MSFETRSWPALFLCIFLFIVVTAGADDCMAHRVSVFAVEEGDMIRVDAKFAGGRKVKEGRVLVFDAQDKVLYEGKTDQEGSCLFKRPSAEALKIVVEAGQGHRGEWSIDAVSNAPSPPNQAAEQRVEAQAGQPSIPPEDIKRMVEEAVERNIRPLKAALFESMERGFSLRDVMGGIGYIVGLVGLAAYFRARGSASRGGRCD